MELYILFNLFYFLLNNILFQFIHNLFYLIDYLDSLSKYGLIL